MQLPPLHTSLTVHTLPSEHPAVVGLNPQPVLGSQLSAVQGLLSLQVTAAPLLQLPFLQLSPWVQALPSSQLPLAGALTQPPLGSQLSVVQALLSPQAFAAPGLQPPALHASPVVQTLPSSHGAEFTANMQPLSGSHASSVQGLPSAHCSGVPAAHAPSLHASPLEHRLPSSHGKRLF